MNINCPDKDTLQEFVDSKLGKELSKNIAEHVSGCNKCGATIDGLRGTIDVSAVGDDKSQELLADIKGNAMGIPYKQTNFSGFTINQKYLVIELIGQGSHGTVYEAENIDLGHKKVAIKILKSNKSFLLRFENEKKALVKLDHPGIVGAFDAGEFEYQGLSFDFLVMELVEGPNLAQIVEHRGPLEWREACRIGSEVCDALSFAEQNEVVHRDIKPSNILRREFDGKIKIVDWGLVRLNDSPRSRTETGVIMGTLDFISPEQAISAKGVDSRADVYSLCCTLFFVLLGKAPYESFSIDKKAKAHLIEPVPRSQKINSEIPLALSDIVASGMAKSASDRPLPRELGAALSDLWETKTGAVEHSESLPNTREDVSIGDRPTTRVKKRLTPYLILVPLLAIGLGIAIKFALTGPDNLPSNQSEDDPRIAATEYESGNKVAKGLEGSDDPDQELIGWQRGGPTEIPGLVHFPADQGNVWQINSLAPTSINSVSWGNREEYVLSNDGKRLIVLGSHQASLLNSRRPEFLEVFSGDWFHAAFSPDDQWIALMPERNGNGLLKIFDRIGRQRTQIDIRKFGMRSGFLQWCQSGTRLLCYSRERLLVFDLDGNLLGSLPDDPSQKLGPKFQLAGIHHQEWQPNQQVVCWYPDEEQIYFCTSQNKLKTWRWGDGSVVEIETELDENRPLYGATWNSNGTLLALDGDSKYIFEKSESGELKNIATIKKDVSRKMEWAGDKLATGQGKVYDRSGNLKRKFDVEPGRLNLHPNWNNGSEISFASNPGFAFRGGGNIQTFSTDGRSLWSHQVPNVANIQSVVRSSSDPGNFLIFSGTGIAKSVIHNVSPVSSKRESVVSKLGHMEHPLLAPVTNRFVYQDQSGRRHIATVTNSAKSDVEFKEEADEIRWNNAGTKLANLAYLATKNSRKSIGVYDATTSMQKQFELPQSYDDFEWIPANSMQDWSPDDRFLAMTVKDNNKYRLVLWDVVDDVEAGNFELPGQNTTVRWSPNGKWLAVAGSVPKPFHHFVHVEGSSQETVFEGVTITHHPDFFWASDSQTVVSEAGVIYEVTNNILIRRKTHVAFNGTRAVNTTGIDNERQRFLALRQTSSDAEHPTRFQLEAFDFDGNPTGAIPVELPTSDSWNFKDRLCTEGKFLALDRTHDIAKGVVFIDLENNRVAASFMPFSDGQCISILAGGQLVEQPKDIDKYVIHKIHYPGGRSIGLTRKQFLDRLELSYEQQCLLWVLDLNGRVELTNSTVLSSRHDLVGYESIPNPQDVESIDLDRIRQISGESLEKLAPFSNLKRLSLSGSSIESLQGLPELGDLRHLDVSSLSLEGSLNNLVGSEKAILSQTSLETINIGGTIFDTRFLRSVASLPSLKSMLLNGTSLSDEEISDLKSDFPNIEFVTE